MSRKPRISPEDRQLFREAVKGARPLTQDRVPPPANRPPPRPAQRLRDEERVLEELLCEPLDPLELETGEELLFRREGVQHSTWRKLRRGGYSVAAELDLHGMTAAQAREAVGAFLRQSSQSGRRCVRIIHGKGNGSFRQQPVLKAKINHWLRQREEILAFCSARPVDGGTGAVYVLIRRPRE